LIDKFHTGLQNGLGEPYIMVPTASLAKVFEEVIGTFGSGGKTIIYMQGKDFAISRWRLFSLLLGPNAEKRTDEIFSIFESFGIGSLSVVPESQGKALRLVVRDCFECSVGTTKGRRCEFTRGMSVGYFSGAFGKDVTCRETKCRLKGDKVCEFVLESLDGKSLTQVPATPQPS
ncbi:MAG TPA: V4R domain-containing protein, partial [Nitrososphaerales archaeon]